MAGLRIDLVEPDRTNVVDLMAALKKSLGEPAKETAKPPAAKPKRAAATQAAKPSRKRA
jgi:non-homologous end joining protein Ku